MGGERTNAERQRRYIAKLKAARATGVSNAPCAACAAKDAEIARLKAAAALGVSNAEELCTLTQLKAALGVTNAEELRTLTPPRAALPLPDDDDDNHPDGPIITGRKRVDKKKRRTASPPTTPKPPRVLKPLVSLTPEEIGERPTNIGIVNNKYGPPVMLMSQDLLQELRSQRMAVPVELEAWDMEVRSGNIGHLRHGEQTAKRFTRNIIIIIVVEGIRKLFGFDPTGRSQHQRSACEIVAEALGVIGISMGRKNVEAVWDKYKANAAWLPSWSLPAPAS